MTTEVPSATISQGQQSSNLENSIDLIANVLKNAVSSTPELEAHVNLPCVKKHLFLIAMSVELIPMSTTPVLLFE